MKILLTNDDGIESLGLRRLEAALELEHEVWVVAPEANRSGSSHSITLGNAVKFRQVGPKAYASAGTPADCVLYACMGLVPVDFDLVLAGINLGPNLGTDIVYSGTAAAARQGAFMGKASVACSLASFQPPYHLEPCLSFMVRNLAKIRALWSDEHFLNINFPNREALSQPVVTVPTRRIYKDELVRFSSPEGDQYCFLGGEIPDGGREEGSDLWAVENGFISLSPIVIHPANHEVEERYREVSFS